jgi:predicted ferric reductase
MKPTGLSPETRPLRWTLFVLAVAGILIGTGPTAIAIASDWLTTHQESLPWYASRLLGFLAYGALAASVIYGLLLSTGLLDALTHRAVSFTLHQELSAIAIGLTALHGAVLALDTFVHTTPIELLVPFTGPYKPIWVGIGQLAFYVVVVVYASFYARSRIGQRGWRLLHYTTLLAFLGATAHGVMAGTDSPTPWAFWIYAGSSVAVIFLVAYRIAMSVGKSAQSANTTRGGPA